MTYIYYKLLGLNYSISYKLYIWVRIAFHQYISVLILKEIYKQTTTTLCSNYFVYYYAKC